MRARRVISGAIVLVVSMVGALAHATYTGGSGVSCQGYGNDSTPVGVGRNYQGTYASGATTTTKVDCPIEFGSITATSHPVNQVVLFASDGAGTDRVECSVYQAFTDLSVYFSATKHTCSTGGGCPTTSTDYSYVGQTYLIWSATDLTANLTTQYLATNYGIQCTIPAPSYDYSRIHNYYSDF